MDSQYSKYDIKRGIKLPDRITPELAYLSGVLMGDGSMGHREDKHEYWIKCVGNSKDEVEYYNEVLCSLFAKVFGFCSNPKLHDRKTTYGFSFVSKTIVGYLTKELGHPLGKKYNSLKIPNQFKKDKNLLISFLSGLFDTDGCISFKKGNKNYPHYPVISVSSKSKSFTKEIARLLKNLEFKIFEIYDYIKKDNRVKSGYTVINSIELSGKNNLDKWNKIIGFSSPKHINKINIYSRRRI